MTDRRTLLIGAAAALFAAPAFARRPFRALFNRRNLAGWTAVGDANWRVQGGIVSADRGTLGFLLSRESYRNFELRVEVWISEDANSGIFIRCEDRVRVSPDTSYEVNLFDRRPDPSYGTGAIVNLARVSPMPRAGGRWNVMTIRAAGDRFTVTLNGVTTVDGARDGTHREGAIALQYGAGLVRFRKVEIRVL